MSGLAGHMPHIHEDYTLTLSQLKNLLKELSSGTVFGTEKLDGQNLYISYSLKEGCAKAARNLGNIKSGGLDANSLAEKFRGRGSIEKSFNEAFASFEKVVSLMTEEEVRNIFGEDANTYYNVEVIDPRTSNIIEYTEKAVVIHRSNHKGDSNIVELEIALERIKSNDYGVHLNERRVLPSSDIDEHIDKISTLFSDRGLGEDSTIADFVVNGCLPSVMELGLSRHTNSQILKRLVTGNKPNLNEIKKGYDKETQTKISNLVKDKSVRRNAISPLENSLGECSAHMLKNFSSNYLKSDNIQNFSEQIQAAKKIIEESPYDKARDILNFNMSRLVHIEGNLMESEGFAFEYGDKVFKITGNFSPINQILGLYNFGRGEVPALKEEQDIDPEKVPVQKIALFPGAFKPPHMGHFRSVESILRDNKADKVVVLISNPSSEKSQRSLGSGRVISSADSKEIWEKMAAGNPNIEIVVSDQPSPVSSVFDYVGEDGSAPKGASIVLVASEKGSDAKRFSSVSKYVRDDLQVSVEALPSVQHSVSYLHNLSQDKEILNNMPSILNSESPKDFHASDMRYLIGLAQDGNKNAKYLLNDFLPKNVVDYVLTLFSVDLSEDFQAKMKKRLSKAHSRLLDQGGQENSAPYTKKREKDKSNAFLAKEEEEIEEISSMGSGAVAGYSAPLGTKKKKKKKNFPIYIG